MDIISMQMASKALKKLDAHYSGFDHKTVATAEQTEVVSPKEFDPRGYTLKVYVDGIRALRGHDYTIKDNRTVTFATPLKEGEVVLFTTDVAGVPEYHITEEYDDTEIKSSLSDVVAKVGNIITALDEDGDGEIVDTIADIKNQWATADSELQLLIQNKVEMNQVEEAIKDKVGMSQVLAAIEEHNQNTTKIIHELEIRMHDAEVRVELHKGEIEYLKSKISILEGGAR